MQIDQRKNRVQLVLVTVAAALCCSTIACRQNQPPQAAQEQTSSPATPAAGTPESSVRRDGPLIVAFGDSLTAGVAGRSYPEQLQDLLDEHHEKFRVENQGVSGDTTTDGLARIDNVIAARPSLVLLEFGGNDGLRGIPVEASRHNLDKMIADLQHAKLPLVLLGITLPPNYGPDYVKPFTAMFPELAKKHAIPVMPFLLQNVYRNSSLMQPDGIHPNGDGNRIVAADVYALITPLLARIKAR